MSSFLYPTDRRILNGLRDCLESLRMGNPPSLLYPLPPTVEQLEELLNCAYAASLETEEGRNIAFTVDFFDNSEEPFPYHIKQPLPLLPRDLARLAVALDPWRSRICTVPVGKRSRSPGSFISANSSPFTGHGGHCVSYRYECWGQGSC